MRENLLKQIIMPHLNYINKKTRVSKSGKIGKTKFLNEDTSSEPLILDESLYFSDLSGNIYKYSLINEEIVWKFNFYKRNSKNNVLLKLI